MLSLFDAKTNQLKRRISVSDAKLLSASFTPDSEYLITVSSNGRISQIDVATGKVVWNELHKGAPIFPPLGSPDFGKVIYTGAKEVAVSPDGSMIATSGNAKGTKVWRRNADGVGYTRFQTLPSQNGGTIAASFAPDNSLITAGNNRVTTWKLVSGQFVQPTFVEFKAAVNNVALTSDGSRLAIAAGEAVYLYERGSDGSIKPFREIRDHVEKVTALAFTPDGSRLATGSLDRTIFVHSVATGAKLQTINQPMLGIRGLVYDPSGVNLAVTFFDNKGGPTIDIELKYGFFDGLGGSAHNQVREDYIKDFILAGKE